MKKGKGEFERLTEEEAQKKYKGKTPTLIDLLDFEILEVLKIKKKIKTTELRDIIGLTHPNFLTHMRRLKDLISKERDKQTIYLSLNEAGKKVLALLEELGNKEDNKNIIKGTKPKR